MPVLALALALALVVWCTDRSTIVHWSSRCDITLMPLSTASPSETSSCPGLPVVGWGAGWGRKRCVCKTIPGGQGVVDGVGRQQ